MLDLWIECVCVCLMEHLSVLVLFFSFFLPLKYKHLFQAVYTKSDWWFFVGKHLKPIRCFPSAIPLYEYYCSCVWVSVVWDLLLLTEVCLVCINCFLCVSQSLLSVSMLYVGYKINIFLIFDLYCFGIYCMIFLMFSGENPLAHMSC